LMGTTDMGNSTALRSGRIPTRSGLVDSAEAPDSMHETVVRIPPRSSPCTAGRLTPGARSLPASCCARRALVLISALSAPGAGPTCTNRRRRLNLWPTVLAGALQLITTACSTTPPPRSPTETLREYARALEEGRVHAAYALLSDEAKKSITFEAFRRMIEENSEEVLDIARALNRPAGAPLVTATVTAPDGEELVLIYEDGRWRVDASGIDLYSQSTPRAAVTAFIRAFENQRFDVLMRFVPESKLEGLDAAKLKKAWAGEQKEEMQRLTQALKAALPTAKIERIGARATMAYGAGGTVEMVNEAGVWKIEELR